MKDTQDAISAFLDDERFDGQELADALSTPEGRDLLIDLVALRHLTASEGKEFATSAASGSRRWLPRLVAAAALLLALLGGYIIGDRRRAMTTPDAPSATRVVEVQATWQVDLPGRLQ
jgi:hypothetical protein